MSTEIIIIRNAFVSSLYDVVLADFEGESSKYLQEFLTFEQAIDIRKEFGIMHNIETEQEEEIEVSA